MRPELRNTHPHLDIDMERGYAIPQQELEMPEDWPNIAAMTAEIKVVPCSLRSDLVKHNWINPNVYSMKKRCRGRCLIISNKTFHGPLKKDSTGATHCILSKRHGTVKDANDLKLLFQQLYFDVIICNDLTVKAIHSQLQREAAHPAQNQAECFVCVICSHGDRTGVYGTDGEVISLENVTEYFDGEHCKSLRSKPKMFFLQACQGGTADRPSSNVVDGGLDLSDLLAKADQLNPDEECYDTVDSISVPTKSDMLVACATHPGYVSLRNVQYGSWFIQAVKYVFQKYAFKEDIHGLLTLVNRLVARGRAAINRKGPCDVMQASVFNTSLTKKFLFFPGVDAESESPHIPRCLLSNTIKLFVLSGENKTSTVEIHEDAMIWELHKKVAESGAGAEEDDIRLIYAGKDLFLERNLTLKDCNIQNQTTLLAIMRLSGVSIATLPAGQPLVQPTGKPTVNPTKQQTVNPKIYDNYVQLSHRPDMFTLDDSEGGQRAEMPCGHVISPESLTMYCRHLLNAGKYEFCCPYREIQSDTICNAVWEFRIVKRFALLTSEEIKEFEEQMAKNYLKRYVSVKSCLICKTFCERKCKIDKRVECLVCKTNSGTKYQFCWVCLRAWKASGLKNCGNYDCNSEDSWSLILRNCPMKRVIDVHCPSIRACPACDTLIEHTYACKQMTCPCGQHFCFICLKTVSDCRVYQYGPWNFKCTVAPVQIPLPGY